MYVCTYVFARAIVPVSAYTFDCDSARLCGGWRPLHVGSNSKRPALDASDRVRSLTSAGWPPATSRRRSSGAQQNWKNAAHGSSTAAFVVHNSHSIWDRNNWHCRMELLVRKARMGGTDGLRWMKISWGCCCTLMKHLQNRRICQKRHLHFKWQTTPSTQLID